MRVAIVHYWLIDRRGGERVVDALCRLYPRADVFTNVLDTKVFAPLISSHSVRTTFIDGLPFASRFRDVYLPLMPLALDLLDLREYDLVISSESGPAKGVVARPDAVHICYCHSPMRYVWDMAEAYLRGAGPIRRTLMRPAIHYLRMWDFLSAQRPDAIVANSDHTRRRIKKYWGREAVVLHPPVDTGRFRAASCENPAGDYFLCAGQLEGYKRIDLAVDVFTQLKLPLVVVGTGPLLASLKHRAGPSVRFTGALPEEEFALMVAGCRALIFPGEEDFGIVPVEAMAAGRPVIAFGRGGALDSVVEGESGVFFESQSVEALKNAVLKFLNVEGRFDSARIAARASHFDAAQFITRFEVIANEVLAELRPRKQAMEAASSG